MSVHLLFWRWNGTALSDLRRPAGGPSQVVEWTRSLMKHSEKTCFTSTFSTVNPMFSARIEPGLSGWEASDQPSEPWQGQTKGSHCRSSVSCGWDTGTRSWKWRLYGRFLRSRTPKKLLVSARARIFLLSTSWTTWSYIVAISVTWSASRGILAGDAFYGLGLLV